MTIVMQQALFGAAACKEPLLCESSLILSAIRCLTARTLWFAWLSGLLGALQARGDENGVQQSDAAAIRLASHRRGVHIDTHDLCAQGIRVPIFLSYVTAGDV
eukprot:scaffold79056_cov35-Prasinocladus_malaysianus.AAC.1